MLAAVFMYLYIYIYIYICWIWGSLRSGNHFETNNIPISKATHHQTSVSGHFMYFMVFFCKCRYLLPIVVYLSVCRVGVPSRKRFVSGIPPVPQLESLTNPFSPCVSTDMVVFHAAQKSPEVVVTFEVGTEGGYPRNTIIWRWPFLNLEPVCLYFSFCLKSGELWW